MTLFDKGLNEDARRVIDENIDLINKHIKDWVRNQRNVDSDIASEVINFFAIVKRRYNPSQQNLHKTPERTRLINKLVLRGYDIPQFRAVIEYMVKEWWDTPMQKNLTPETLFASSNFTKYLEQAREDYLMKKSIVMSDKKEELTNPYQDLVK